MTYKLNISLKPGSYISNGTMVLVASQYIIINNYMQSKLCQIIQIVANSST